jgi:F0F1-type ATP synthase membrane subunit a
MTVVPLLLRPLIILLGLLVGFIQAFIFTLLSIVYVGGAVRGHAERSH